ncbi:MAG: DUF4252 domain-containing protein [Luteibaculaceae bacterium]
MKYRINIIALLLTLSFTFFGTACNEEIPPVNEYVKSFFDSYSNTEGVRVVNLNPQFYKNFLDERSELSAIMDQLTFLKIFISKKDSDVSLEAEQQLSSVTKQAGFKKVVDVKDEDGTDITAYVFKTSKDSKEFICQVKDKELFVILSIGGNIDSDKLIKIVEDPTLRTFERSTFLRL